ncbi:adenosylcobinamide-GDP ribazoletransferase [Blastococcus sp. CCUG 61487]|uniref:adenosylcobinamide-GDP ribazoletransferase n=1 Tax=Blastococcus sp. CCUG 61487 TaxID=1840703 RepID=UPI0024C27B6F|nr:adenosylcobinamide-GDP ribazoletransferase [Blastococcus sp. CCUG 61487]
MVHRRRAARAGGAAAGAWLIRGPGHAGVVVGAMAAGWLGAELLHRRARTRLGGTTGDVMGAMGETTTAATLLVAAALW